MRLDRVKEKVKKKAVHFLERSDQFISEFLAKFGGAKAWEKLKHKFGHSQEKANPESESEQQTASSPPSTSSEPLDKDNSNNSNNNREEEGAEYESKDEEQGSNDEDYDAQ